MQLTLIENTDNTKKVLYKLARIIYAETLATSLRKVESMASMICNIHNKYNKSFEDISCDEDLFESLNEKSERHIYFNVCADDKKFQMCVRVVNTMLHGQLDDYVFGATKFHHANVMPEWARSRGYIAEYEDILFYL